MQRHPTSAEPAAAPTHTLIIRSDRALTLAARTDDEARGRLWAELVTSGVAPQLRASEWAILSALASLVNGQHFRASGGELIAWPGERHLLQLTGLRRAMLWRSLGRLAGALDLIERIELAREGAAPFLAWRLKIPQLPTPDVNRTAAKMRAYSSRRPRLLARALMSTGARATPSDPSDTYRARANNTPKIEPQRPTPAAPPPADSEDAAAPRRADLFGSADGADGCADGGIVDRLTAAGVSRRQALRLAPTTTAGHVSRVLAAAAGRELDSPPAWIVYMIQHPAEVPRLRRGTKTGGRGESPKEEKRKARAATIDPTVAGNAARLAAMPPAAAAAAIAAAAAELSKGNASMRRRLGAVTQAELAEGKWPSLATTILTAAAELAPA
jgi:hypothetical protein